jgi:hypothetical protein
VLGGILNVPGEVNTDRLVNPPEGITPGAICGPVMVPVILAAATAPVNPNRCVLPSLKIRVVPFEETAILCPL